MSNQIVQPTKRLNQEKRREALLQAAETVFIEHGYINASLDMIIKLAGGSKRNIYTAFGSKEELFLALIKGKATKALSALSKSERVGVNLRTDLQDFAGKYLNVMLSPSVLGLSRVIQMDGIRFPTLINTFFEVGPYRAIEQLVNILEAAKQRGDIVVDSSTQTASLFIGMLRGNILYMHAMLRISPAPNKEELKVLITSAVDILLDGIQTR